MRLTSVPVARSFPLSSCERHSPATLAVATRTVFVTMKSLNPTVRARAARAAA